MKIFVSSTFEDLADHRFSVNEVLARMQQRFSAMEYFGSRADEAVPACKEEIAKSDTLVGIYAWRYGWRPEPAGKSITEIEFDFARECGKRCLCYLVDEDYPWPPRLIERGDAAECLREFKAKVNRLVRSTFRTPDNLAKQVAADISRDLSSSLSQESFGGLLSVNWEVFSPELQDVLSTAYSQARVEAEDGVVATRHVVTALKNTPSTARSLIESLQRVQIQPLIESRPEPSVEELFTYDKPISSCVIATMNRLLPSHSPSQRLLAIELAVDLIKHGRGSSVANFRQAGVDARAVDKTMKHIGQIAENERLLSDALASLDDAQVLHISYLADVILPQDLAGANLRRRTLENARKEGKILLLIGELMRRHSELVLIE